MNKASFFPKLAMVNLARNGQFYLPYLLTVACSAAAYYIARALAASRDLPLMTRYAYLSAFMTFGTFVIALFSIIFLTYTNGFLMKRRRRELGLYNILGLGKGHLALMLGVETAYTAVFGIGGGILLGLLLQKAVTLLLYKLLAMDAYFGFYVSWTGIRGTAVLFGLILLGNLGLNLLRMGRQSPVELLREGGAGEREPKPTGPPPSWESCPLAEGTASPFSPGPPWRRSRCTFRRCSWSSSAPTACSPPSASRC